MSYVCFHNGVLLTGITRFDRGAVFVHEKKIVDVFNESRIFQKNLPKETRFIDVDGAYICPGLIDTHIHGTGGFGTDITSHDNHVIVEMARVLPQYGVTSFCPTMYPMPVPKMNEVLSHIVQDIEYYNSLATTENAAISPDRRVATEETHTCGANILGIHMEGPFISTKRLGVHKPECAAMPSISVMEEFIRLGKGHISNMTVAPELKGMHEIALLANNHNIVLQAGHTDAEYENILEGIQVGITHSTHFFNAMSRLHHRNPGTVGAIMIHSEMSCEVIADGHHVHPELIKLLLSNKPVEKLVLITDAITPTGLTTNPLYANKEEVVFRGGVFHTVPDDIIAGSALTMIQGLKNLVSWGISIDDAICMASYNPANILNRKSKGRLIPNCDADIIVLNKNLDVKYTMIGGSVFYERS